MSGTGEYKHIDTGTQIQSLISFPSFIYMHIPTLLSVPSRYMYISHISASQGERYLAVGRQAASI